MSRDQSETSPPGHDDQSAESNAPTSPATGRRLWEAAYPYLRGVAVAIFIIVGIGIGMHLGGPSSDAPPGEPVDVGDGRQQLYTCSMHPQVRLSDPNAPCPYCGMSLIPVRADDDDEDDQLPRLRLGERALALLQLQVQPAEWRDITVPVRLFGQIAYDETRLKTVTAWVPGRIERLHIDFTGATVGQGDPLFDLYSPELIAAQEELLQAHRASGLFTPADTDRDRQSAQRTVQAASDRLRFLGMTAEQIDQLIDRGEVEDYVTIRAPIGGTVIERQAARGDYLATGQPVYRIADLGHLWSRMEVFESELHWLALGQKVSFVMPSFPGMTFEGKITFIEPTVTEATRAVRVRADVPNPDGRLKPGMFVRGTVEAKLSDSAVAMMRTDGKTDDQEHPGDHDPGSHGIYEPEDDPERHGRPPVVIPASAPLITGRRAVVYVQLPDQERPSFEGRDVLLGPKAGDWYVVLDGLEEGELVVTRGAFRLDAELQLKGRPSMMQPAGDHAPAHDHGDEQARRPGADPDVKPLEAPEEFQAALGRLIQANFGLVESLAGDSPEQARRRSQDVRAVLDAIEVDELEEEAQKRWRDSKRTMAEALEALGTEEDLANQRQRFEAFSDHLTEMVRVFGVTGTATVYRAMCPMVNGREGFWLQDVQQIANPYHGASMLRCGEIVETLVEVESR
ncbi:MAG: efflux RND transporter periplasmic adaptor subunit [Phycisphaeraceae bacterium]|nr:efflux RND transporter periplasmic adaptor subunit [Phycisphaeraceae bacterium]